MNMQEKLEALSKPFHPNEIEWLITGYNRDKTKGLAVPFVSNRAIQNRLDEVFGLYGWKNEFKPWRNDTAQLCGISIWDDEKKEWLTKWDGAPDSDIEPIKGGLSSAMKRAAGMLKIGRYLYDIEPTWVPIEPNSSGKGYHMVKGSEPSLPTWALPEGVKNQTTQPPKPQVAPTPTAPPQKTTPQATSPSTPKLTERQVNRAYVKGKNALMTEAEVEDMSMTAYNKPVVNLTRDEYDELCAHLDSLS